MLKASLPVDRTWILDDPSVSCDAAMQRGFSAKSLAHHQRVKMLMIAGLVPVAAELQHHAPEHPEQLDCSGIPAVQD